MPVSWYLHFSEFVRTLSGQNGNVQRLSPRDVPLSSQPITPSSRFLNFPNPKDQASFNQFGFQALLGPVTMVKVWNMLTGQDRVTCSS